MQFIGSTRVNGYKNDCTGVRDMKIIALESMVTRIITLESMVTRIKTLLFTGHRGKEQVSRSLDNFLDSTTVVCSEPKVSLDN